MKRGLILILLIIFSLPAMGQYDLFGQYNNPFSVWGSKTKTPAGGNYVQRAWDFFNRVTALGKTLTAAQQRWYNDSIFVPLLDSGLIGQTRSGDSLQALWVFCKFAGDTTILKMNLLSDSNTCTNISAGITWTDSGVVGNGSSAYLNANFNPVWDSTIVKLNSAGLLVYVVGGTAEDNKYYMGNASSSETAILRQTANILTTINGSPWELSAASDIPVIVSSCRLSSTKVYQAFNGVSGTLTTKNVGTQTSLPMYILSANSTNIFTSHTIAFASVTSGLSNDKTRKLHNILNNSLKGRGYNVY